MNKLVIALLLSLFSSTAFAAEYVALRANPGNSCAAYRGSFDVDGYLGPAALKPTVRCTLNDGVSSCTVTGLPSPFHPTMNFKGDYGISEGAFYVEGRGSFPGVDGTTARLTVRVLCTREDGCVQFQMWNRDNFLGFACDITKFAEAPKPEPKAPPLLRKPDASNAPKKAASQPLSF